MIRPQIYKAKIKDKVQVTHKVQKLVLTYLDPLEMNFIPGQFINLKCPNNRYRAYSISSDHKNKKEMYLLAETGHQGIGSNYIRNMQIGDEIEFIGPSGVLSLYEPVPQNIKMFATGTGIAPFISMLHRMIDTGYEGNIELFFGSRHENEVLEATHLKIFAAQLPGFSYKIYISQPESALSENMHSGHITKELENIDKNTRYYACGHPDMVDEVYNKLWSAGVLEENIVTEGFTHSRA